MRFHIVVDGSFEAEDIDDAFVVLSKHFKQQYDYFNREDDDTSTEPSELLDGEIDVHSADACG